MKWTSKYLAGVLSAAAAATLAACSAPSEESATTTVEPELPVSINAVMISVVDHSADYLFAMGNGDMPQNDHDWDLVRTASYEAILGGTLTQMVGTGPNDAEWVADVGWQSMADDLSTIGQEALTLTEAKSTDTEAWRALGDRLVENCLACHEAFKPEIPSEGILHESTERESKGESIFD